jgi:hypothetical protein
VSQAVPLTPAKLEPYGELPPGLDEGALEALVQAIERLAAQVE